MSCSVMKSAQYIGGGDLTQMNHEVHRTAS
jgi:hypothetical protein